MSNEIVYVCNRCDYDFTLEESHRWTCDGDVVTVCPNCGSDDIDEAKRCPVCREIVRQLRGGVCGHCFDDAVDAYKALFEYLTPWQKEALEDEYGTIDITEN